MPILRLTAKSVAALVSPTERAREDYFDDKQKHLTFALSKTGKAAWYWTGRVNGRRTRLKLGDYPAIGCEKARELASICEARVLTGSPARVKDEPQNMTIAHVWQWYMTNVSKPNKRSWKEDESGYRLYLELWAGRSLVSITRDEIIERRNELRKQSKGAVNAFLDCLRAIFNTARANDWCQRNPVHGIPKETYDSRDRFLSGDEMPKFFAAIQSLSHSVRDLFLIGIYTGARRTNVCQMKWSDIDLDRGIWTIPSASYKTKKATTIILSQQAIEILRTRATFVRSDWVFPGRTNDRPVANIKRQWAKLLKTSELSDLRFHDLRRTLASWQAQAGQSLQIIGKTLGHEGTAATGIYARLQLDAVRQAVDSATLAIENAGNPVDPKKS